MRNPKRSVREPAFTTETGTTTGDETSGDKSRKPKKVLKKKLARKSGSRNRDGGKECCSPCCAVLAVLLVTFAIIALALAIVYPLDKFGVFGNLCTVDIDPEAIYKCASTGTCNDADAKTAVDCITGSSADKKCCLDKEYLKKNPPKPSVQTAKPTEAPTTASTISK